MEINFTNNNLADSRKRQGKYGHVIKQLNRRIDLLASVTNLEQFEKDFPHLRCHEYSGVDEGTFTVDVSGNWRLRFRPTNDPEFKPDGGIDKSKITSITIIEVLDPH